MKRFAVCTYLLQALGAVAGWLLFRFALPQYAFALYWTVPALFMALSLLAVGVLKVAADKPSRQTVNWIFGAKLAKFVVAITYFIVYVKAVAEQNAAFACVFLAFYFITLSVETFYFSKLLKSKHV